MIFRKLLAKLSTFQACVLKLVHLFVIFSEIRSFWKKMGVLGFLGITAEPEYGGTGASYLDHCIIMEEISR